jgi:hypothetical protein
MGDISLKQNRQSLIKKLACKVNNTLNGTKSLDPKKMSNHVDHFKKTFGKELRAKGEMTIQYQAPELRFTTEDILDAISKTSLGKAAGADELFSEFWHYGKDIIAPHLTNLFNKILVSGEIPEVWKRALICPIYKKGDPATASNYRPIAITSSCRRIFEKCVYSKLVSQHVGKLADSQCGFRPNRNCQQQIFALHEAMVNTKCEVVLLDQAAAYDSVNRDLLWSKLRAQFDIPYTTISVLKVLFDNNYSTLVIKNTISQPIINKSGLLQGSALSPILFNMFNNDLLARLGNCKGVKVHGSKITNLAFADDIAIVSEDFAHLQEAVTIAEKWASENDMKFNAKKCVYLGPANNGPNLDNEIIPKETMAKYLGVIFNHSGVDTIATARDRAAKANARTLLFGRNGMNLNGATIEASVVLYKQFIRPMLEYGIQFMDDKGMKILQRAQENALRKMFNANRNSSRAALHLLARVEHLRERQVLIQASFFGFLHNNNNSSIPAVKIWWNSLMNGNSKTSQITRMLDKKSIFHVIPRRNHMVNKLTRMDPNTTPTPILNAVVREAAKLKGRKELKITKQGIADSLNEYNTKNYRFILSDISLPNQIRSDVIKWLIGNVCWHMKCLNCLGNNELSRQHGLECSGVEQEIKIIFDYDYNRFKEANVERNSKITVLDAILFKARDFRNPTFYELISRWIVLIQTRCLRLKRSIHGGWYDPTSNPAKDGAMEEPAPLDFESVKRWRGHISGNMEFPESIYTHELSSKIAHGLEYTPNRSNDEIPEYGKEIVETRFKKKRKKGGQG